MIILDFVVELCNVREGWQPLTTPLGKQLFCICVS